MIIISGLEGIKSGKEDLRDDVVSKMIKELDGKHILGGFNQNQIGVFF